MISIRLCFLRHFRYPLVIANLLHRKIKNDSLCFSPFPLRKGSSVKTCECQDGGERRWNAEMWEIDTFFFFSFRRSFVSLEKWLGPVETQGRTLLNFFFVNSNSRIFCFAYYTIWMELYVRKEENRERKERLCNDSEIEVMNKYSNESIGYLEINWKGKGGDSFDSSVWVLNCRWKGKKEKNSINIRTDDNLHYHRDSNLLKKKIK